MSEQGASTGEDDFNATLEYHGPAFPPNHPLTSAAPVLAGSVRRDPVDLMQTRSPEGELKRAQAGAVRRCARVDPVKTRHPAGRSRMAFDEQVRVSRATGPALRSSIDPCSENHSAFRAAANKRCTVVHGSTIGDLRGCPGSLHATFSRLRDPARTPPLAALAIKVGDLDRLRIEVVQTAQIDREHVLAIRSFSAPPGANAAVGAE